MMKVQADLKLIEKKLYRLTSEVKLHAVKVGGSGCIQKSEMDKSAMQYKSKRFLKC